MENSAVKMEEDVSSDSKTHKLYDNWTMWAHLPHDTDWTVKSYKKIMTLDTVEATLALCATMPEKMVKNCMLFLMRDGIKPIWEDTRNRDGGCFSYKVANKLVAQTWKQLSYSLVGETLTNDLKLRPNINGITISPKKNFCIIKIWLADCSFQNPEKIESVDGISSHGCLFKKWQPEY